MNNKYNNLKGVKGGGPFSWMNPFGSPKKTNTNTVAAAPRPPPSQPVSSAKPVAQPLRPPPPQPIAATAAPTTSSNSLTSFFGLKSNSPASSSQTAEGNGIMVPVDPDLEDPNQGETELTGPCKEAQYKYKIALKNRNQKIVEHKTKMIDYAKKITEYQDYINNSNNLENKIKEETKAVKDTYLDTCKNDSTKQFEQAILNVIGRHNSMEAANPYGYDAKMRTAYIYLFLLAIVQELKHETYVNERKRKDEANSNPQQMQQQQPPPSNSAPTEQFAPVVEEPVAPIAAPEEQFAPIVEPVAAPEEQFAPVVEAERPMVGGAFADNGLKNKYPTLKLTDYDIKISTADAANARKKTLGGTTAILDEISYFKRFSGYFKLLLKKLYPELCGNPLCEQSQESVEEEYLTNLDGSVKTGVRNYYEIVELKLDPEDYNEPKKPGIDFVEAFLTKKKMNTRYGSKIVNYNEVIKSVHTDFLLLKINLIQALHNCFIRENTLNSMKTNDNTKTKEQVYIESIMNIVNYDRNGTQSEYGVKYGTNDQDNTYLGNYGFGSLVYNSAKRNIITEKASSGVGTVGRGISGFFRGVKGGRTRKLHKNKKRRTRKGRKYRSKNKTRK